MLYVDVDDFKRVNDLYGHATGDAVLVALARRLANTVRPADTVARLGGDEFAVLLEDADDPMQTAARISAALKSPFVLAGTTRSVHASVGVAAVSADEPPVSADTLLARSDAAMYAAKRGGKATIVSFDAELAAVADPEQLVPSQN